MTTGNVTDEVNMKYIKGERDKDTDFKVDEGGCPSRLAIHQNDSTHLL